MVFPAVFSIVVGAGMIGQWVLFYVSRQIPELETEPIRIWFHIAAEMVTAALLIFGGVGMLLKQGWGVQVHIVSVGMLFYTAIVSPGYFAQKGQWRWLVMFAILIVLGVTSILLVV